MATRPTADRLRETLFNVLAGRVEGASFLDLYAGSGAVGLEALSRGAAYVVFVERAPAALRVLGANLARLEITAGFTIQAASAAATLGRPAPRRFDLVFLDPPYEAEGEYETALGLLGDPERGWLAGDAIVVAEHRRRSPPGEAFGSLSRSRLLGQGDHALSFYRTAVASPPAS